MHAGAQPRPRTCICRKLLMAKSQARLIHSAYPAVRTRSDSWYVAFNLPNSRQNW